MFDNNIKQEPLRGLLGMGGGIAFGISGSAGTSGPVYADDLFSTYLYEGVPSTGTTVNNGIDLLGEGGMVWVKNRTSTSNNLIYDTERGGGVSLVTTSTAGNGSDSDGPSTFLSNGFTTGSSPSADHVSWTFRKEENFFTISTWNGDGTSGREIPHDLGSAPGLVIVKRTDSTGGNWFVNHHDNVASERYFFLDSDSQADTSTILAGGYVSAVGSSSFRVYDFGTGMANVNATGGTYIAYIFGRNQATFGPNSDKSVVRTGAFVSDGSNIGAEILGFEPQWLLVKQWNNSGGHWFIFDTMRGFHTTAVGNTGADINYLRANNGGAEGDYPYIFLNSDGFTWDGSSIGSHSFIYVAIGRLPKPPTSAADVFKVYAQTTGTAAQGDVDYGITADLVLFKKYNSSSNNNLPIWVDRVRGENYRLDSTSPSPQYTDNGSVDFDRQDGITINNDVNNLYSGSFSYRHYVWKRAAKFFDIVTWLGSGSVTTIPHNLQIKPEMIIVKNITYSPSTNWIVWHKDIGDTLINLNSSDAWLNSGPSSTYGGTGVGTTTGAEFIANSTDSVIGLSGAFPVNGSGHRYISYLFASLDGVSKVGSYTGQTSGSYVAATLTFTPKFIMIKAADRTGDWNVFDVERGLFVGGTSAVAVALNTTDNESQTGETDAIRVGTNKFTINTGSASTDINESGKKYLYYAVA
jgi:hypothetical protein